MADRLEPTPQGGVPSIEEAFAAEHGQKAPAGKEEKVTPPPWFKRLGPTTFTIETGFGKVECRTLGFLEMEALRKAVRKYVRKLLADDEQEALSDSGNAREALEKMRGQYTSNLVGIVSVVECLVDVPSEWKRPKGEPLPPLSTVQGADKSIAEKDAFFSALPGSIADQIGAAFNLMSIPPLAYEQAIGAASPS